MRRRKTNSKVQWLQYFFFFCSSFLFSSFLLHSNHLNDWKLDASVYEYSVNHFNIYHHIQMNSILSMIFSHKNYMNILKFTLISFQLSSFHFTFQIIYTLYNMYIRCITLLNNSKMRVRVCLPQNPNRLTFMR